MKILIWGFSLPLISFLLHFLIWKVRRPYKQTRALVLIFYGTFFLWVLIIVGVVAENTEFIKYIPNNLASYAHIFLLFNFLTFVYIGFYSLLEADSPSLLIVKAIKEAGEIGIEKNKLYHSLGDDVLVKPRMHDLLRDNMANLRGSKYIITSKGRAMVRILQCHRNLAGIERKGG